MKKVELSSEQRKVVYANDDKIIVCAGAGSGKTRVLTERVKRILNETKNGNSIVVITFTNEAADELKERLEGVPHSDECFIGTIHAFANKILRHSGKEFDIFSEYYQTNFMQILIPKYAKICNLQDYMLYVKYDRLVAAGKMSKNEVYRKFPSVAVYDEIQYLLGEKYNYRYPETVKTLCKANNIITFDELIEESTKYFKENNLSLRYLFVDEFQDIGYLEYNFFMALNAENMFVVGDTFQNIFSFKGGDVHIFMSLVNNPEWTTYKLIENYRTCKSVLIYANSIIHKASDIIDQDVKSMRDEYGNLEFIAKSMIDDFISKFNKDEKLFILVRTNKDLNKIAAILTEHDIKYNAIRRTDGTQKQSRKNQMKHNISIMTVHTSKGLECDNVAIYGKFPVNGKGDSDEIKVYYVALTRTISRCTVFV